MAKKPVPMGPPFQALRNALSAVAPAAGSKAATAAVAIIFRVQRNRPEVLLIRRAERSADPWSAQLAFPGGRRQPDDPSEEATARRETFEEVGIQLQDCALLLGAAPWVRTHKTRPDAAPLIVAPYVYVCQREVELVPQPAEVAEAFWTDLLPLCHGLVDTEIDWLRDGRPQRFPGYRIDDAVLWGLSYAMLKPLLSQIAEEWSDVPA